MWTILNNLLSNAIKYSPDGGTIELRLWQDGDQAVFQIQDFGIGIPEADQKYLFSTYYRGSNVGAVPGTGLGLAIVRQAVKAHGGSISFDSREGEGTLFTVILPIHDA
jgi:signal transduction histidine kinase